MPGLPSGILTQLENLRLTLAPAALGGNEALPSGMGHGACHHRTRKRVPCWNFQRWKLGGQRWLGNRRDVVGVGGGPRAGIPERQARQVAVRSGTEGSEQAEGWDWRV